jgi:hypothetical protein
MCASEGDKIKTLHIIDSLNLMPFSLFHDGVELNASTNKGVLERLLTHDQHHMQPIIPTKRPHVSIDSTPGSNTDASNNRPQYIHNMICMLLYHNALTDRSYVELDDELCDFANPDLKFKPQMKYAIAQLFAGSILINIRNGNALMADTVQLYGRTKTVDVHREVFGKKNASDIPTSLPPPFKTSHTNVWPATVHHKDGEKLIIGTQRCNILDVFAPPSTTRLTIKGNEALNKLLEELAPFLSSTISTANRTSQAAITCAFTCFDLPTNPGNPQATHQLPETTPLATILYSNGRQRLQ